MTVKLDGSLMTDRDVLHDYLKLQFGFPDYYGKNLDALFDLLTDSFIADIVITNTEKMLYNLGDYGRSLIATFEDAADENRFLSIKFI